MNIYKTKKIIFYVICILLLLVYIWGFDNFKIYNIKQQDLEVERDKIISRGFDDYEITDTLETKNSITYKFEYGDKEYGIITFIKSIFVNKWIFEGIEVSNNFQNGEIIYHPYTQEEVYSIVCNSEQMYIVYDKKGANRLYTRVMAIIVVLGAYAIGRIYGSRRNKI